VGAPHIDHAAAEAARIRRLIVGRPLAHAGEGLDLRPRPVRSGAARRLLISIGPMAAFESDLEYIVCRVVGDVPAAGVEADKAL